MTEQLTLSLFRVSFTEGTLSTFSHAFWRIWAGEDSYELLIDFWYKKFASLIPRYMLCKWPLLVAYWPPLETEVLTGLSLRPSILSFPFVLGYRNNTPQVQRNHRDFLLEDRVKGRCCISSTGRLPIPSSAYWKVLWFYRKTPVSSVPWPLCNPWVELCEQQSKFIYFMNNRTTITHDGTDWRLLLCIPLARCPWSKIGCKSLHNWLYFRHTVSFGYPGQKLAPSAHFCRLLLIASGLAIFSVSGKEKNCLCKVASFCVRRSGDLLLHRYTKK